MAQAPEKRSAAPLKVTAKLPVLNTVLPGQEILAQDAGHGIPAVPSALAARNDAEAMTAWLAAHRRSLKTFDAYRRQAVRLLTWMQEHRLTLRQLTVEHVHLYYQHLADPPAHWLRPRKPAAGVVLAPTQLLVAGLSNKSLLYARTVLAEMASYLREANYLAVNVFSLSNKPAVVLQSVPTRFLDLDAWTWFWSWLTTSFPEQVSGQEAARARWLFAILYHTGIRREELVTCKMGDFVCTNGHWTLRTVGKGGKERFVTINSVLLEELARYRRSLKLRDLPSPGEIRPLVMSSHQRRAATPLTGRAILAAVKLTASQAAAACPDEHIRAQIGQMSTHWMRHTSATHRLMAGARPDTVQEELGHASLNTTRIYAKTLDDSRRIDAEKLAQLTKTTKIE